MITTIRNTLIGAIISVTLLGLGLAAINYADNHGTAEYRITWTGDAPPTRALYTAFGAIHTASQNEIASHGSHWSYDLPYHEGLHLHLEVTQPYPYHGVTAAYIIINGTPVATADTTFGRKSIILDYPSAGRTP